MDHSNEATNPLDLFNKLFGGAIEDVPLNSPQQIQSSGRNNSYYLIYIAHPKRLDPYWAECEDIIEALGLTFQEGEAFKAIWRNAMIRQGLGKPDDTELRNAEKVAHYGARMEAMAQRKLDHVD